MSKQTFWEKYSQFENIPKDVQFDVEKNTQNIHIYKLWTYCFKNT